MIVNISDIIISTGFSMLFNEFFNYAFFYSSGFARERCDES